MVKLNRIYTRTGDDGTTGLADGTRRAKSHPRIRAMGSVEEANAALGIARLHAGADLDRILAQIQNDLFDLGADLAVPESETGPSGYVPLRITAPQTATLERHIDATNAQLTPLNSFILPAGAPLSVHLHMARTIIRRSESDLVALSETGEPLNPEVIRYINRLSDLLFVLARLANDQGRADVLWVPHKTVTA